MCGLLDGADVPAWVNRPLAAWDSGNVRTTLLWVAYNTGPTIQGTILGSPIFGNSLMPRVTQSSFATRWVCRQYHVAMRGHVYSSRGPVVVLADSVQQAPFKVSGLV